MAKPILTVGIPGNPSDEHVNAMSANLKEYLKDDYYVLTYSTTSMEIQFNVIGWDDAETWNSFPVSGKTWSERIKEMQERQANNQRQA